MEIEVHTVSNTETQTTKETKDSTIITQGILHIILTKDVMRKERAEIQRRQSHHLRSDSLGELGSGYRVTLMVVEKLLLTSN